MNLLLEHVIRKFPQKLIILYITSYRYDGVNFQTEPSSKYSHANVLSLAIYEGSPFVTGDFTSERFGLKTEVLDRESGKWAELSDYPFSNGDRFQKIRNFKKQYIYLRITSV